MLKLIKSNEVFNECEININLEKKIWSEILSNMQLSKNAMYKKNFKF